LVDGSGRLFQKGKRGHLLDPNAKTGLKQANSNQEMNARVATLKARV